MDEEAALRERLRKIEALFARPGGEGERLAAGAARDRVRQRLAELQGREPAAEMVFMIGDQWSRWLVLAVSNFFSFWENYPRSGG
jgi:hypothetical protein